jgi:hypothetical protein
MPTGRFARARSILLYESERLERPRSGTLSKTGRVRHEKASRQRDGACDGFALVRPGAEACSGQPGAVEIAVIASLHGDTERRSGALDE